MKYSMSLFNFYITTAAVSLAADVEDWGLPSVLMGGEVEKYIWEFSPVISS